MAFRTIRRPLPALLLAATVALPHAPAQGPTAAPHRIGVFLWHDSPNDRAALAGVRQGLRDAEVAATFELRLADSDPELAARQLAELDAGCELVLSLGTRATLLAREHVRRRPIVFAAVTNPVTAGITEDWRGAGAGSCGASNWIAPQNVLEVFRLAVPDLRALGMLRSRKSGVVSQAELAGMRQFLATEGAPDVQVHEVVVDDERGLAAAVAALRDQGVQAIWIPIDLTVYQHVPAIERALGDRPLPLLTTAAAGVRNGALVGAAVDYRLHGRRAAAIVQRVLRLGRIPDDLPVDRMQSSLVVANLGAARRLGIDLPLSLLALADELIAPEPGSDVEPR
jgi:putative ABC transport system substrate-binding protein